MANYKVALDAGHGGSDPGAVYKGRQEKDDTLKLTLAIGEILEENGVDVYYIRDNDVYETPYKKAVDANMADADLFVSVHRNSSEYPDQYSGVETLVYNDSGMKADLARQINSNLEELGFRNIGVTERPNLVVLKRTKMPAVMIEAGFINNSADNELFDNQFNNIAKEIADAILDTAVYSQTGTRPTPPPVPAPPSNSMPPSQPPFPSIPSVPEEEGTSVLYRVQVGAYRNRESADRLLNSLLSQGFPAFIVYEDGLYKVQSGAFQFLSNAIKMEERLRRFRYNTYITT